MSFTIPATVPRPTDQELEDPDLLHAYFEKNFAKDPVHKQELQELTEGFCFDSYESFTQHLSGRGITYETSSWTGRAGGSGVYTDPSNYTQRVATGRSQTPPTVAQPIPSTPFATPQAALDGLKKNLTLHYQKTYKSLGGLLEACERDGSVMLNVPNIVAGGFGIFTQAMIQGEQSAKLGLRDVLGNYVGLTGAERDGAVDALCGFYERVMTQALGPEWRDSAEFKDYVARFKADGNGFVNVLGLDPFVNIEPSTFEFTRGLFQNHPEAYTELQKIQDSVTYEFIAEKVTEQRLYISRALEEIASIKTPDHLYDLIHNFANYGPARKFIYNELGITEEMVIVAQDQVGKTKWVRDPYDPKGYMLESVPDRKPDGMDDQTWALVSCLARRKTAIERGETAFLVLSIGGSILAGVAAGTVAGVLSGGNPIVAGYAAATTAMATAGAIGTRQVMMVDHESEWAQGARAVAIFEHIPIGSSQMVAFLEDKKTYTMIAAGGNVILAGLGAGAATAITQTLSGQILKRVAVQALYGSLDGMASVAIDGNVNNQERLTQATVLAGGKAEDAPTVTQVFFTAAVLGGVIGGTAEAVFNPGEIKIAMELATGKLKFYDVAGNPINVKVCVKVKDGVYKVTNDKSQVAYFQVDEKKIGVPLDKPKTKSPAVAPTKPKDEQAQTAPQMRRPATREDVQAYLAAHPELKSQNIPDDVLETAILRYLNNPEQEFGIGAFNTGHEFQDGTDAAHAATTPLGADDGYSAAEADFFGYELSAHFHGGKTSLDERMLQTTGREFDDDLQFLAARARVHHQYNLNNADNPSASALPTSLTHEIFGVGVDGQIAKLTVTASYDPERDAVRFAIDGVNVGEGMLKQVRARSLEVDNEVRAMPPGHLEQMAGQEAASIYDKRRLAEQLQPLVPMPANLKQQLRDLAPGESVTIGRDFPIDGVDLNRTVEVALGRVGCPVSRQHLQIQKNADETFTLIDISKAGTLIRKTDGTVYQTFIAKIDDTGSLSRFVKNLKTGDIDKDVQEISLTAGDEIIFPNGERFIFEPDRPFGKPAAEEAVPKDESPLGGSPLPRAKTPLETLTEDITLKSNRHDTFYISVLPDGKIRNSPRKPESLTSGVEAYQFKYDWGNGNWEMSEYRGKYLGAYDFYYDRSVLVMRGNNSQNLAMKNGIKIPLVLGRPPVPKRETLAHETMKKLPWSTIDDTIDAYQNDRFPPEGGFYKDHMNETPGADRDMAAGQTIDLQAQARRDGGDVGLSPFDQRLLREMYNDFPEDLAAPRPPSGGWYWSLYSAHSMDAEGRIYFSLNPKMAKEFFETVCRRQKELRELGIATIFKMAAKKADLERGDSAVLYFKAKDQKTIYEAVLSIYHEAEAIAHARPDYRDAFMFKDNVPPMTSQLVDERGRPIQGITFGQEPPGRRGAHSFGTIRDKALKEACREIAVRQKDPGQELLPEEVNGIIAMTFARNGLDIDNTGFNLEGTNLLRYIYDHTL